MLWRHAAANGDGQHGHQPPQNTNPPGTIRIENTAANALAGFEDVCTSRGPP
jgi:hypothetical protein